MFVPLILLLTGCAGAVVALTYPDLSDLLMLAVPWVLASLFLLVQAYRRGRPKAAPRWIVVDGSMGRTSCTGWMAPRNWRRRAR